MTDREGTVTGLIPCPVVILTAAAEGQRDAMTATAIFVAEVPPLVSVSLAEHHLTNELIEKSGEFVVNLATPDLIDLVRRLGSSHGRDVDKIEAFDVETEPSETVLPPRIAGAYACLEGKVLESHSAALYRVHTAEVSASVLHEGRKALLWHRGRYYSVGARVA